MKQPKGIETEKHTCTTRLVRLRQIMEDLIITEYVEEGRRNKEKNRRPKSELSGNSLRDSKKQGQFESGGDRCSTNIC